MNFVVKNGSKILRIVCSFGRHENVTACETILECGQRAFNSGQNKTAVHGSDRP